MKRLLLLAVLVALAVLGYGYWHGVTHAAFSISTQMPGATGGRGFVPGAEIILRDAAGLELARGRNAMQYNFVRLIHPQVGDCNAAEQAAAGSSAGRKAWQACFEQQARWIPRWADRVNSVSLSTATCDGPAVPVRVRKYAADWLLWWVPLPHVGGKPYTYYSLSLKLPEHRCADVE
ncbi:hypothetical protein [Marinobacterium sedimentorum]|uniref:hypothetical protein n=1 Tax=Marinobacterium sedimentorum TaxID=2927804 RepID=UPI0020C5B549|nr:hypothetical protein [Marinobacterium sedimentorum]MCP8686596.1 hypothetical protein [Marinobacterium sedimentorum]